MKVRLLTGIILITLLSVMAGACAPQTAPPVLGPVPVPVPTADLNGTLKVYVTDARPREEITGIIVTVSEVQVHKALAEQEQEQQQSATGNLTQEQEQEQHQTQQGGGEWISIAIDDASRTFDLLDIEGIEQYLGTSEIEAVKYTQVRLVIETVQVELGSSGILEDARIPSKELMIVRPFNIVKGETTALVIDFDADRMVTVTGSGDMIVKPVVKLTVKQEKPQDQKDNAKQEVSLEGTKWILQSYGEPENLKDVLEDTEITATFNKEEGQVTGSAGCNSYFGSYEAEDANLSIPGPIGATEMSCGEQKDTQEREYLSILQAAESYEIEDGKLTINCGNYVLILWK